jgi:hypothetical protein
MTDQQKLAAEVTKKVTDYVNTYGDKSKEFNAAMSREHRTLQQSFTKLCLQWLEHVASDKYETDVRNACSKEVAKVLLDGFIDAQAKAGFSGNTLLLMSKPSGHLPLV